MTASLRKRFLIVVALAALMSAMPVVSGQTTGGVESLQRGFEHPPDDSKIMMRWWWFGPSVAKPQLEREMRLMKEGGIGGFEIQPVYPLALDDAAAGIKNMQFLSDEFIDALRFTSDKARELGMRVDLTVGSGWPYGGPQVPVTEAAGKLRVERIKVSNQTSVAVPKIAEGEKLLAAFWVNTASNSYRQLTDIKDGAIALPANREPGHEVMVFVSSRTRMMVKRPSVGSEGFVMDHYDRAALANYLSKVGDRLLQAFGPNPPYAIFCDSLEVFNSDWTGDFLTEFQRRRGYDLLPLLPALATDIGPQTAAIRHDWGQTLTELLNERFLAPMHEWAKKNGTRFRIQGYGIPPMTISGNAHADLTEGEGTHWKVVRAARWASSANHLYGRNVTSSETWTWLHSPSFRATPLDVKAEADLHFLQGVNQLIGHGWPYTSPGVEYPGWRFYAAAVFNEKNPWWIAMPDLSLYLQRISYLMRQGQPANDVAMYLPNSDGWVSFGNKRAYLIEILRDQLGTDVLSRTLEAGFNFDFFDDDSLRQLGRVEKDSLLLGKNRYKAVILPNVERIPLATLRQLETFARNGGKVIATRRLPALAPGYKATEAEQAETRAIVARLFGASGIGHFVENEKRDLAAKLTSLLQPDMALSPEANDIGFVHRKTEAADIYFIANTSNTRQTLKATFRVKGMQAEWWDSFTGKVAPAFAEQTANGARLEFSLEPYASRVLVFSKRKLPLPSSSKLAALPAPIDLSSGWQVTFGENKSPVQMNALRSWADNEQTRFFSGVASYEKEVTIPDWMLSNGIQLALDFGEGKAVAVEERRNGMRAWLDAPVRDAGVVYVNDSRAGSIWCPPYSLNITGLLKPGVNKIRIAVANTAINYMAGHAQPDYRALTQKYGERFQAQDMDNLQPLPSGLLGSVRLIAR
ncbi:MAG: glycosyl hydrolase [Blastocatellia bacterium]